MRTPLDTPVVHAGYIKLHRSIMEHPVWENPERLKLWLYLLLKANHKARKIWISGEEIEIPAGSMLTSLDKLSEGAGLTKKQIRGTLDAFERAHMVARKKAHHGTLLTIENWALYQSPSEKKGTTEGTTEGTERAHERASTGHAEGIDRAHEGHAKGTKQEVKNISIEQSEKKSDARTPQTPVDSPADQDDTCDTVKNFEMMSYLLDEHFCEFRQSAIGYGMRCSTEEWSAAHRWAWSKLSTPERMLAIEGLRVRADVGDDSLVNATPQNYLLKRMWERNIRKPQQRQHEPEIPLYVPSWKTTPNA